MNPSGAEEGCIGRGGTEPEHERLVVVLGAGEQVAGELYRLVVKREGDTFLQHPCGVAEVQVRTVGTIGYNVALALVHPVVGEQFALVAGEVVAVGGGYLVDVQRFGPEACLQHIAVEALTIDERRGYIECRLIGQRTGGRVGHLAGAGEEADGLRLIVEGQDDAREGEHR